MESDQLKLLGRSIGPVDSAVAGAGALGLRIFVEDPLTVANVASVLNRAKEQMPNSKRGPIHLRLADPKLPGEVDMDLKQHFPVSPEIKGALKSLDGVLAVDEF